MLILMSGANYFQHCYAHPITQFKKDGGLKCYLSRVRLCFEKKFKKFYITEVIEQDNCTGFLLQAVVIYI